jgi:ribulose 1,5-bisphosphate synthetase/thiazole synthase
MSVVLITAAIATAVDFDVVVYGSSPAGIAAATAAGHLGMRVAIYEPLKMIGGMGAAGNLALNDGGTSAEKTGLARNFTLLNGKYYGVDTQVAHPESFVAEQSFHTMLREAGVARVRMDCRLLSAATTTTRGVSRVQSLTLLCEPQPVTATVFIDASYDAEVVVAAGDVPYTAGREATSQYNESLAGARVPGWTGVHGPRHVNALRADGSLLKYVSNLTELAAPGTADDALMAFQHRMYIT